MDEYIEREALEIELNHRLSFLMAENGEYDAYTSGFDECVDRVENFQSAFDVAPVVHGRWLNFVNDYSTAECDKYGEIYEVSDYHDEKHFNAFKRFYKYCPNCGAKMNGGKENE